MIVGKGLIASRRNGGFINRTLSGGAALAQDHTTTRVATAEAAETAKASTRFAKDQLKAFVERIEGSYSGVMGLPLFETAAILRKFGIVVP